MKTDKRATRKGLLRLATLVTALVLCLAALPRAAYADSASISYEVHCQTYGWMDPKSDGALAGTTGQAKRVEALRNVTLSGVEGGVQINAHVQSYGWMGYKDAGSELIGTTGERKRIEAIQVVLTGQAANEYYVYYRVHCQTYGWTDWVCDGATAGTTGKAKRIEAVEIKLVRKASGMVNYLVHGQTYGWQDEVCDGGEAGTDGQAKRVEAIRIRLGDTGYAGGVSYRVHAQSYGWMDAVADGALAGTQGKAKRIEAVRISLTGDVANHYDIYYRAHVQTYGWMDWACNGAIAGSTGLGKRVEAIEIQLVPKGGAAPGGTDVPYVSEASIMGAAKTNAAQIARYYRNTMGDGTYPSTALTAGGAPTVDDFARIVYEEAAAEGVRPEIVFAQAMHETNWLRYTGDVKVEQFNYAGLGATGGGNPGYSFPDVRTGVRAQVQHLKAYASKAALVNDCVDPRFQYVKRGIAPTVYDLDGRWAVPGDGYGANIMKYVNRLLQA